MPSASFPTLDQLATDPTLAWRAFGVAQTGQLDKANARTTDAVGIVRRCEERDRAVIERLNRPWWAIWR